VRSQSGKIRVLQVIGSAHIGGAEKVVVDLVRRLDPARFEVALCCTRGLGVRADELKADGVEVMLAAPGSRILRHLTPLALRSRIARWRADVVHTHGTPGLLHTGPLGALGLLPPWIHTFHYGRYGELQNRQMTLERMFCRAATQLVAVSNAQRQSIIKAHRLRAESIVTILNGVEEQPEADPVQARLQARADLGLAPDDVVVGCVAVLSIQKGITYLLQAAAKIAGRAPHVKFLIVGGGPAEKALKSEAETLGIGSRVLFTGWRPDGRRLLPALDIFVMSSLWEAMPMALLEAMAARRAIVVTDVSDNRSVVENGACAVLVPPGDAGAIADALQTLVNDREMAVAMGERAYRRFAEGFTTGRMVSEYEALYERLSGVTPRVAAGRAVMAQ
jgi:glycosyltransferase involved in cell wall biosynthesis